MIEERNQGYEGQGIRGPLWTVAGTAIGGLVTGVLGALVGRGPGGNPGPSKDMQISELKAQNFTLQSVAPIQQQQAFQNASLGYLQRTVDAVVKPMVPMLNVAGPAFPPPPYPFPPFPFPAPTTGAAGNTGTVTPETT